MMMRRTKQQRMPTRRRLIDASLSLLDRQVLDIDDVPVQVVTDIELSEVALDHPIPVGTPAPTVTALLSGPVLATRIFGGRPPTHRLHRIDWAHVAEIGIALSLSVRGSSLDVTWVERWLSGHVVGRIPGGHDDPE